MTKFEELLDEVKKSESSPASLYDEEELRKALENAYVSVTERYEKERFIMWFHADNGVMVDVFSSGNISVTIGGAKSRKTFFSTMLLSAFGSKKSEFGMKGELGAKMALFIDTEQAKYHVQKVGKRIATITGTQCEQFDILSLREVPNMKMRLAMVDYHLRMNPKKYAFVCIDGIVDLVTDFNNQEECRNVVSQVMAWSSKYKCHINCIIHTNKDKGAARGHLGAELINKAETAIRVQKSDGGFSQVSCEASRNREFEKFDFTVNDQGLPVRELMPVGYYDNEPKESAAPINYEDNKDFINEEPF